MRNSTPDTLTLSLFDGSVCSFCKQWYPLTEAMHKSLRCRRCRTTLASASKNRHRESYRKASRKYKKSHAEAVRQRGIARRERCQVVIRAQKAEYLKKNPDWCRMHNHNRRAKIRGNGGSYTIAQWRALCDYYDNKCLCCGDKKPLTIDHIVPISKGGTNDIANIQPILKPCNNKKYTRTIDFKVRAAMEAAQAMPRSAPTMDAQGGGG